MVSICNVIVGVVTDCIVSSEDTINVDGIEEWKSEGVVLKSGVVVG